MERRSFLQNATGCCALSVLGAAGLATPLVALEPAPARADPDPEKQFLQAWITDLMDTLQAEFDEKTQRKLMAGCGRGCFRRHAFKTDIAAAGKGNRDKLIQAMKTTFEVWEEGSDIHVRFGPVSKGCYCPAAKYRPAHENDAHCHCSRATQQAIFETALGKPIKVEILQAVRRGHPTCHFLVQGA